MAMPITSVLTHNTLLAADSESKYCSAPCPVLGVCISRSDATESDRVEAVQTFREKKFSKSSKQQTNEA